MSSQPTTTEDSPVRSTAESRWLRFVHNHNSRMQHMNYGSRTVEIKLAGLPGVVEVNKNKLIEKSDFFRAMLSSSFQEAASGSVTVHDDDPGALASVLRYISEDSKYFFTTNFVAIQDLVNGIEGWLGLMFLTADKYGVEGLRRMIIKDMKSHAIFDCRLRLEKGCWQNRFINNHYQPLKEAFGGAYPSELYPVFAEAMASYTRWARVPVDKMVAVAREDAELGRYVFGRYGVEDGPVRRCSADLEVCTCNKKVRQSKGVAKKKRR